MTGSSPGDADAPRELGELRREYARGRLEEGDLHADPLALFARWFDEARAVLGAEPNAMTLATVSADGTPSARVVLLKALDARGFVFFTDYRSRKAAELAAVPRAALVLYWPELERQVRVVGDVERVTRDETELYFATRPLDSRLGAWASHQSSPLSGREELERRFEDVRGRFAQVEGVPAPPHWGGFRVLPHEIEFWQGRPGRLHDRFRFTRAQGDSTWHCSRLFP